MQPLIGCRVNDRLTQIPGRMYRLVPTSGSGSSVVVVVVVVVVVLAVVVDTRGRDNTRSRVRLD